MFKEYGELSTLLYQHTKPVGLSVAGDIEYYSEKLQQVKMPILEAGVGTGRMLIPLLQKGLTVDGLDLSAEMLTQCKINLEKYGLSAKLYQQNLLELSLSQKYGAIIMPTGSFCLLPKEHVGLVLASFFAHLEKDGKVIIDLELPINFKSGEMSSYSYPLDDDRGIQFTSYSQEIDWISQKVSYIHKYELIKQGEIQKTEVSNFVLYWYGILEFELLLKSAGFEGISREIGYGDDDKSYLVTFIGHRNN